ncbi:DUF3598 family protein [Mastigocoleus testarum]|uniref:Uncharacterized protein n=1 Tax=Mastigocoleus testarum BC008 TaxID=371196 RepID=A0A0V7ZVL7_9CYAN|nr:DUF3598 family protein [Mastigocoleus testarum]KST68671.1 hypothetical protein BC008_01565 [Mastigocoleus testarum BC008]KST68685.1 hypothetical protein BC008_01640 [Mastigocoleus testarum BC008]
MKSQWECFLENLAVWEGSFTTFSPQGELLKDTPSRLTLEGYNNNQNARLTLQMEGERDIVLEFSPQGIGGIMFFENGAFSQGPMQFSRFSLFGGEFGLIHENNRSRLVQIFDSNSRISKITVIREHKAGTNKKERPLLHIDDLLGKWEGEAITIYPDLRSPDNYTTKMQLQLDGSGRLRQNLSFGDRTISSSATVKGSVLHFDKDQENPVNVLFLPGGSSATFPVEAQSGKPIFLESGWLIEPNLRQRLIRSYNEKGEWVSLTLVTERKI